MEADDGWTNEAWLEWEQDSKKWRGRVLTGRYRHWCNEWDGLPIDETCPEWPCGCYPGVSDNGSNESEGDE